MRNFKLEANELLQRSELKTVLGGREDEPATCVAGCGQNEAAVCYGSNCSATEGEGCTSDEETVNCPS